MAGDIEIILKRFDLEDPGYQLEIPAALFVKGWAGPFSDSASFDLWAMRRLGPGWEYQEEWSNGYRSVCVNRELRAILTYVEGDVDLTVDADEETFGKRLAGAAEFYSKH